MARDFAEYYNKIKDHVQIDLYYRVMPRCLFCDFEDCLAKFDWCIIPHDENLREGRDLI